MRVQLSFALCLLGLGGCTISEENFPERAAETMCDKAEECDDLASSYQNCVSTWEGIVQAWVEVSEDLNYEYDPGEAQSCVASVRRLSCDERDDWDFEAECGDVFR